MHLINIWLQSRQQFLQHYIACMGVCADDAKITAKMESILAVLKKYDNIPQFPLSAEDLMRLNFKGRYIGIALKDAKDYWIKQNFKAQKQELIAWVEALLKP